MKLCFADYEQTNESWYTKIQLGLAQYPYCIRNLNLIGPPPAETAGIQWACTACTFINEPNDSCCSMCDTKRFISSNPEPSSAVPEVITLSDPSSEVRINIFIPFCNYDKEVKDF